MENAKVYFTSFKATQHENLLQKLHRLMKTAGFESIDFTDKYAAIKIHFGEYGNLAFLTSRSLAENRFSRTAIPCTWAAARMRWTTWRPPM